MLEDARPSPQMQEWLDRLGPLAANAAVRLSQVSLPKLAMRTGCELNGDGDFELCLMGRDYLVCPPMFEVIRADSGAEASAFTTSLVLTYMVTADGTTPSRRWIGFRELPDGMFYVQAFQGYSGARLVRELREREAGVAHVLRRARGVLRAQALAIGDAGFAYQALPRVRMALAGWEGDAELPSQATVLFEDTAAHYMPTDGLAILGSQLVDRVLAVTAPT